MAKYNPMDIITTESVTLNIMIYPYQNVIPP